MNDLRRPLEGQARELGADAFGVADLTPARDFIVAQGGEFLGRFPWALSVGVRLPEGIKEHMKVMPRHSDSPDVLGEGRKEDARCRSV